ncbi:MAG: DNA repair protein RecO [Candidatus Pelagibacter sp.]|jgi:DNA repair protein RecO (recombination protein O)|tara:strand:+ start:756 stop:1430 length:675 start_codon:yes stop_codon:yes gene_type:complete
MNWQDKGYLLSLNKYNENSSIAEFYTENNGKIVGVIFGSTSKKIKSYLLIGNKFHINSKIREDGRLGYLKVEIDEIKTPVYLENKKKLFCIIYCMNLIKILTAENENNIEIYNLLEKLFKLIESDNWLVEFLYLELNILKSVGYDINFRDYVVDKNINGQIKYIVVSSQKIIPNFLIDKNISPENLKDIYNGFSIVGDFLDKTIIKPNNKNYPSSRNDFLNLLK